MKADLFKQKTEHLLKYSPRAERHFITPINKTCEYCTSTVKNQRVECIAYRLGTANQYFKHTCKSCKFVLFDGSVMKNPNKKPTEPMDIIDYTSKKGSKMRRPVQTPDGIFESLTHSAIHYKRTPCAMLYWMRKRPTEFYYL